MIQTLLAGRSALALFPTGAGKSLCYQLPAVLLPGTALVVSPLIALMKDQTERLRARGVAAARLDSSLGAAEEEAVLADFAAGRLKLLYLAPERLARPDFRETLAAVPLSLLAVDEAHCLSAWGHNFRPDYLRVAGVAAERPGLPVLALTATASPRVAEDIRRAFRIAPEDHVQTSFLRPNLRLRLTPTPPEKRLALLVKHLRSAKRLPAVVYVTRQETAEHVATRLGKAGLRARAYHAGLPDDQRAEAQEAFMSGECQVVVATAAFGMGVDKADVRGVFHFNLPRSLDHYTQESGRAGRDGKTAYCELLADASDRIELENFIFGDTPSPESVRLALDSLLRRGPVCGVSLHHLSQTADMRPAVLETLITRLELEGVLVRSPEAAWTRGRMKLLRSEEHILTGHPPGARAKLRALLFADGAPAWQWRAVDVPAAAARLETPEEELRALLEDLETNGDVTLRRGGWRWTFTLCGDETKRNPRALAERFGALFARHEEAELARLEEMLAFLQEPGCLWRRLLAHYGEDMPEPCGTCDRCRHPDKSPPPLTGLEPPALTTADAAIVNAAASERLPALRHPRQLARFLCGLPSPAARRDGLTRRELFGALRHLPFRDVLVQAETVL